MHKIAADLGLRSYKLDDIVREAKKGNKEVTVTAMKIEFPTTEDGYVPEGYQPMAVVGKKHMNIGTPVSIDFTPVDDKSELMNLRRQTFVEGQQRIVEKTLHEHVEKLCNSGVNATYGGFVRSY